MITPNAGPELSQYNAEGSIKFDAKIYTHTHLCIKNYNAFIVVVDYPGFEMRPFLK